MLRDEKGNRRIQYREFLAAPFDESNAQASGTIIPGWRRFGDEPIIFTPYNHGLGRAPRFAGFFFAYAARFDDKLQARVTTANGQARIKGRGARPNPRENGAVIEQFGAQRCDQGALRDGDGESFD